MKGKNKFKFGDKVYDWLDKKNYIVVRKTRGKYYIIYDGKYEWKCFELRLKRGWKK